jgi:hypothetical protein
MNKRKKEEDYEISDIRKIEGEISSERTRGTQPTTLQLLSVAGAAGAAGVAAMEGMILRNGLMLKNRKRQGSQRYAGKPSQRFTVIRVPVSTRSREMCSRSKLPQRGQCAFSA